jgi:hypothetical protein
MSTALKEQMAIALGKLGVSPATGRVDGTPTADGIRFATQTVGELASRGYALPAADLDRYVKEASAKVATPPSAAPIAQNAPPGLTQSQKDYLARVMSLERNPAVLRTTLAWLEKLPISSPEKDDAIAMLRAQIVQLEAAASTNETLDRIDEVIKSPGLPQIQAVADKPLAPAVVPTPPKPAIAPVPTSSLPDTPAVVPPTPQPQPLPVALTPTQLTAKTMVDHIRQLQAQYGGPTATMKSKLSTAIVKAFQKAAKTTQDGKPGPGSLILAAGHGQSDLPLVVYWPKSATAATVKQYRDSLYRIADQRSSQGFARDAAELRASAARERGQGGIVGALLA